MYDHRMSGPEETSERSWSKSVIFQMWKLRPREGSSLLRVTQLVSKHAGD